MVIKNFDILEGENGLDVDLGHSPLTYTIILTYPFSISDYALFFGSNELCYIEIHLIKVHYCYDYSKSKLFLTSVSHW